MDLSKLRSLISDLGLSEVYVGFSGGADSSALLLAVNELASELKISLKAVHFQHNLRGDESLADAFWCRDFCRNRQIDFTEISLNVSDDRLNGESLESAARRLRLSSWEKIAGGKTGAAVALGHHADDRIENLFLRLFRGSNSSGLSSMRAVQKLGSVLYIRPMLAFRKSEISEYLKSSGVNDWCEDSSNHENIYKRNFLRNTVLPEIYKSCDFARGGIAQSVNVLEEDADFIEKEAAARFKEIQKAHASTPLQFWQKLHPALRARVLRYWLSRELKRDFVPDKNLLARFSDEISDNNPLSGEGTLIPFETGLYLRIQKSQVHIMDERVPQKPAESMIWDWKRKKEFSWGGLNINSECVLKRHNEKYLKSDPGTVYFDADLLPEKLIIRAAHPGDKMLPFGSDSAVRLKKIFSGMKISSCDKKKHPVLTLEDDTIIWVLGIRRSTFAAVGGITKNLLKIKILRK